MKTPILVVRIYSLTGVFRVSKPLSIQSHQGEYQVHFSNTIDWQGLNAEALATCHFIIDSTVAALYPSLSEVTAHAASVLVIEAIESNKSLEQMPTYVEHFIQHSLRRHHRLIAIGGGIIQDISCFLAATLLRGLDWWYYPTTLLAQADSCIGSKSSLNCGSAKNILGTFTPPKQVFICAEFLKTLTPRELQSGIGEILKIHAIEGSAAFDQLAVDYERLCHDAALLQQYLRRALSIKKHYIEHDEFDRGIRHIMNYGHSFGHAIESASHYAIPHGIAVTIGMDMANYVAVSLNLALAADFERMHTTLKKNYGDFRAIPIDIDAFITAIGFDKKNSGKNQLGLIVLNEASQLVKTTVLNDSLFKAHCQRYLHKHWR